mmetsp:Transcript_7017/g.14061  ORF Transcript_7017/g.14061 Transcript_7017/m.14061 type:complete len:288 (+) Transcript_7017:121-984(+)|eukprot:CAMPEP_0171527510 /NCGR_PEP_ID=MMETSP0959-20130129/11099_1 /TAXON_ID=87120 /ORGANISM="Aurantiochytrium limacinum, Strain ATCCMYA-1381" /LENGTH=287 /DNA_ID=CAMNT_0012069273 /DNA_START=85 /DNA_END=948 /DNA_ORIENTATION=-
MSSSHEEKDTRDERIEVDAADTVVDSASERATSFVARAAESINASREARLRSEEKRQALYEEFGEANMNGWVGEHQALLAAGVLGGDFTSGGGDFMQLHSAKSAGDEEDNEFDAYGERPLSSKDTLEMPSEFAWPLEGNCFELVVQTEATLWGPATPFGIEIVMGPRKLKLEAKRLGDADGQDVEVTFVDPEAEISAENVNSINVSLSTELTLRIEARGDATDVVACVPTVYMTRLVGRCATDPSNVEERSIRVFGPSELKASWRTLQLSEKRIAWSIPPSETDANN